MTMLEKRSVLSWSLTVPSMEGLILYLTSTRKTVLSLRQDPGEGKVSGEGLKEQVELQTTGKAS